MGHPSAAPPPPLTLRVSVLDRCQYRCAYCRPGSLAPFIERREWLSIADYERLAPFLATLGVNKVRFTGGEPLLRPELAAIVRVFRAALPSAPLLLTTNGKLLGRRLGELCAAGLTGATVHIDSLRQDRYRALMGDGELSLVLEALVRAKQHIAEIKVNVVVQRGKNDDELLDFLAFSQRTGVPVRFIELMNTGSNVSYTQQTFFSGHEIVERIRAQAGAAPIGRSRPSDPAALYRTDDGVVFGVIASDTESFCANCNRLRLTASGLLRGCLYQERGIELRTALARGADDELRRLLERAVVDKRSHHPALVPLRASRFSMAETGG